MSNKVKLRPLLELANAMENPKTVAEYKQAVKKAKRIYIQVWFGTSPNWIKISKADALELVKHGKTAEDFDLEFFGTFEDNKFYINGNAI